MAQFAYFDIPTGLLPERVAASVVLTLSPAFVLLISGPSYTKNSMPCSELTAFSVMATMLVLPPLTNVLPNDELARTILPLLATYSAPALAITIGLAVADAWPTHNLPSTGKKKGD